MNKSNPALDPKQDPFDSPDTPDDHEPETVATPEGDNEFAPDQPLRPAPDGLQTPRGSDQRGETQAYKEDKR